MKVCHQFKNMSDKERDLFLEYVESKIQAIEALVTHFPDDAVTLEARIEKYEKHDAFEVEMTLKMPMKTIQATEASHTITKAVDLSKDRLITQIKKTISTIREDQLNARRHASIRKPAIHENADVEKLITEEFLKT